MSLFCRVECYNEKWIFKGLFPLPFDVIAIILLGLRHRTTKMFWSIRWVRRTWVPKIYHYYSSLIANEQKKETKSNADM